jgi:iron complex transport system permease protein
MSSVSFFAFTSAIASALLIYMIAWTNDNKSMTLILAGVVISTMFSGMIMFIHQISSLHNAFVIMRWTMGGVDGSTYSQFINMLLPLGVTLGIIGYLLPQLDHFLTGDDIAHSRGIDIKTCRYLLLLLTALLVGAIVAVCGPIGFVGIIAPHTCRMIFSGVRHRMLAYNSFFVGGAFLTLCDTAARTLTAPIEIPVGIITALLGGPFFLIILIRSKRKLLL